MQPLSVIIGHPEGDHSSVQRLFAQAQVKELDNEQSLPSAIANNGHTLILYTPPGLALARALEQDSEIACDQALQRWSDSTKAILRHFMLNREHCILVNELALTYTPQKVLTTLAGKTDYPINTAREPEFELNAKPLTEALGSCLAYTDTNSSSLYRDLETVADVNGEQTLQQHQASLRKALQRIAADYAQLSVTAEKYHESSQKLQLLQDENHTLQQQLQHTQEALEQSSNDCQKLSEEAANTKIKTAEPNVEKLQELKEENELLLLQLHQVQEELKHYFCEYQKLTDPSSRQAGAAAQFTAPSAGLALETLFDLREEQIIGNNWYDAESDGRWAGPGTTSTLNLPAVGQGPFELVFDIVHALDTSIVKQMQILLNGEPLNLKHKFGKLPIKRFPCQVSAQIDSAQSSQQATWHLEFRFPKTQSPAEKGSDDHRQLAIRLKTILVRALVAPQKG
ncbi:hypothetical protein [Gilvimarinus chinensis]|uniref:hypothetical protein n=1 Tax=Gilvimarinus chinensis TaxID=396005 RepID=UPI0003732494|nr:hypothetical protein [Gilvimarinus chinensis]